MAHDVTLILGDGVGPELAEATKMCIEATGVAINWDEQEAGVDVMAKLGTPMPDSVIESCRRTKVALKAPITTPVGTGFPQRERLSPPGPRPLRVRPAVQDLSPACGPTFRTRRSTW